MPPTTAHQPGRIVTHNNHKEKLFIYLALAKPALPGQFVLFVSSQSKANALNFFVCSDAQHKIKVVISEQHKNIFCYL
jgi:hypothetical protein